MQLINLIFFFYFFIYGCKSASVPRKYVQLTIIHINDFHAHFEEMIPTTGDCKKEEKCIGGYDILIFFQCFNKLI